MRRDFTQPKTRRDKSTTAVFSIFFAQFRAILWNRTYPPPPPSQNHTAPPEPVRDTAAQASPRRRPAQLWLPVGTRHFESRPPILQCYFKRWKPLRALVLHKSCLWATAGYAPSLVGRCAVHSSCWRSLGNEAASFDFQEYSGGMLWLPMAQRGEAVARARSAN